MEFGLDKCATLEIHRGKHVASQGITMPQGGSIKSLDIEESYKYLEILQANDIQHAIAKKAASSEYMKRVRKILILFIYPSHQQLGHTGDKI